MGPQWKCVGPERHRTIWRLWPLFQFYYFLHTPKTRRLSHTQLSGSRQSGFALRLSSPSRLFIFTYTTRPETHKTLRENIYLQHLPLFSFLRPPRRLTSKDVLRLPFGRGHLLFAFFICNPVVAIGLSPFSRNPAPFILCLATASRRSVATLLSSFFFSRPSCGLPAVGALLSPYARRLSVLAVISSA